MSDNTIRSRIAVLRSPLLRILTNNLAAPQVLCFLLLSLISYSQTSLKTQPYRAASLDQYLWSFSKNKGTGNKKDIIDFNVIDNWRQLGSYLEVSDDGKYFAYTINKRTATGTWFSRPDSLVIQAVNNSWRVAFAGAEQGFFAAGDKQYMFQDGKDLCFLQLSDTMQNVVKNVSCYKISQKAWLAYQLKDKDSLMLQNLVTGKKKQFSGITNFEFNNSGDWLVCKNNLKELSLFNLIARKETRFADAVNYAFSADGNSMLIKTNSNLQYISLPQGDIKNIWTTKEKTGLGSYSLDASGKQVLFTIVDSLDAANNAIGYYEQGMNRAVVKISNQTEGISNELRISDASFTDNGNYIKLSLQVKPAATGNLSTEMAGLEVWNSKDLSLQSVQSRQLNKITTYNAIANIESGKIVFVESSKKKLAGGWKKLLKGDFAIAKTDYTDMQGDRFWKGGLYKDSTWLVSLKDRGNHLLPTKSERFWFSPSGNYLVYFDADKGCHYFSYDLRTGVVKDISTNVAKNQLGTIDPLNKQNPKTAGLAAWLENDAGVLVYDDYDIWKFDLAGKEPASNLTNMLGRSNGIMFNMFASGRYNFGDVPVIKISAPLLLRAFNTRTKKSGFYRKDNLNGGIPKLLYLGDYFMNELSGCQDPNLSKEGMAPVRAKNNDTWIAQRQSSNDAPNYYETTDFKKFKRLTDFQPQTDYQWLTEELHSFKHLDGQIGQGILYKPENFDPSKKYPVLIAFYGAFSGNMYQFPDPGYINQAMEPGISPIWFLNNGYLVFTPDIAVAPLKYGQKAFTVIEGAKQYLKTLPYVDGNKLGIASHSWGGKLAAYDFTHSTSIAAAAITEGFLYGNMINVALSTNDDGMSKLDEVENDFQFGNLWEHKNLWLDQTTVLNVDKTVSPLLLLCNKNSSPEYQNQTLQFFTALRRLDKNVWWLKYDKGDHNLYDYKELQDYTIRYTQFFDHYLKYAPAPLWMTQGIPLKLKQVESRLELDPQGQCNPANGEPCPICEAWNKQYQRTPEMFKKEIKEWELDKDIAAELDRKIAERRKELDKQGEIQTKQVMEMLDK